MKYDKIKIKKICKRNGENKMGRLVRALSSDGSAFCSAVDALDICNEIIRIHKPSRTAAAAMGRLCAAGALMGALMKDENDSLTLRINGGGPSGTITCAADFRGNVRCRCDDPTVELPPRADGKINVGGFVGKNGFLAVIHDLGMKEPYATQSPIVSGEIAEDITAYYAISEQIPTVCALGVSIDESGQAKSAGGYIIQLIPPINDASVNFIEKNIENMQSITQMLSSGKSPDEIALMGLEGLGGEILDSWNCGYKCTCSRKKTLKILKGLGEKELTELVRDEKEIEVCCDFCAKKYYFSKEEAESLLSDR